MVMLSELLMTELDTDVVVSGIADDSRSVQSGDVFFAFPGETVDGRDYVADAVARGAAAIVSESSDSAALTVASNDHGVLVCHQSDIKNKLGQIASRFFGHPSQNMRVVAVTGTNGKTSFTHLLSTATAALNERCGLIGTMGHGLPGHLQDPGLTTPAPIKLQSKIRALQNIDCDTVVLEASSHGLAQSRLSGVAVNVAVLTNITRDHLDYHGSFSAYRHAKQKLFLLETLDAVVVNIDDEFAAELIDSIDDSVAIYTYSRAATASVQLLEVAYFAAGFTAEIRLQGLGDIRVNVPLLGAFNVENVLAVAATLRALNYSALQIKQMLEAVRAVPGRMEVLIETDQPAVVIDYAHTPDALAKALLATREHFPAATIHCVFGCGGDRDSGKRSLMGEIASTHADRVLVTNDNPRTESPEAIAREIVSGIAESKASIILDRRSAIFAALAKAANDDVVLIAGKGHEDYQVVEGLSVPFSDRAVVEAAFKGDLQQSQVVGLGATGLSYARYLENRGVEFLAVDDRPAAENIALLNQISQSAKVCAFSDVDLTRAESLFLSPGVPLDRLDIQAARLAGVPVRGDIECFGELANAPILAVTGTNGKSTVAEIVYLLAADQQPGVYLGGNIGTPCLDILSEDASAYVLEVSSYQLELARRLPSNASVVLNLSPDHLDRYSSLQAYYETKLAIYQCTQTPVVNRSLDVPLQLPAGREVVSFGMDGSDKPGEFGVTGTAGSQVITFEGNPLLQVAAMPLKGRHNVENAMAALALGYALGLDLEQMSNRLKRFQGLPHRGEVVAEINGVRFVNDSKATNPGAMQSAVQGFANGRNIRLIAGGLTKGLNFAEAAEQLWPFIQSVYLIGQDSDDLARAFGDSLVGQAGQVVRSGLLASAVREAHADASPGDVVLLAPGCASQDQFANYAERGDMFKSVVQELL